MRTLFRSIVVGAVLAAGGAAVALAAASAEPYLGTWKLNVAKSKFSPGPAPQSITRVYSSAGDSVDLKITGVGGDGAAISRHSIFKLDGKDYDYTGQVEFDAISVKRIDSNHYETTPKKAGKVVGSSTTQFSADGKVFTQVSKGFNASGAPTESTAVYDKQ